MWNRTEFTITIPTFVKTICYLVGMYFFSFKKTYIKLIHTYNKLKKNCIDIYKHLPIFKKNTICTRTMWTKFDYKLNSIKLYKTNSKIKF